MTDWNVVSAFMANVVAWPGSNDPGYVNLHYSMPNPQPDPKKPLLKGMGWPFRDVQSFVSRASWINSIPGKFKDVWFCTSRQREQGVNTKGRPKAVRLAQNAVMQKSIWADVDVGPSEPGKPAKYATVEEALAALLLFQRTVGLPPPSAIVFSGGGIHVYWISKTPLTPAQWQPYASGLKSLLLANAVKCDAGLTTDIVRILRVPGTFNFKYDPPKPVQLSPLPLVMYDFPTQLAMLPPLATLQTSLPAPGHTLFAEGANMASFKGAPILPADGTDLNAGIDKHEDVLLDPRPIFKQCGFFREALKTGGAGYDNALWMYSVLGATFMENGNAIAHAISKGHISYSQADTQALYDRKMAERHDRGLGYPQCSTIQGAGCKACATCPLLPKGKSPLNIRPEVTAAVTSQAPYIGQTPAARALALPVGYDVSPDGIIGKVVEKTSKDGEITTTFVPLFQCVLSNFWAQKFPDCLNYTVTVDKGFTHSASVPHAEMSKTGFRAYLALEPRTLINTAGSPYLEDFFLSMLGKLRAEAAAQEAVPFGWYEDGGKVRGFVFGGNVMLDDGEVRPCGIGDPVIKRYYTPTGDIQAWYDACATVTNRKRPELTCIVLMSFAAPLLKLAAKASIMYSAWGDTGAGKSAAYKVGMGVWGHTILTKGSENSTHNNITTQMKEIRHLPFYWDEITDDKHRELVAKIMHEASDGAEKGRNVSGQRAQDRGLWKLPIMAASNGSYREFIIDRNPNHAASVVRVLEWHVKKIDGGPGHMEDADATITIDKLESNYGQMGLKYAQYLATNHIRIADEVRLMCNKVQREFSGGSAERVWTTGVALMILAARYAAVMGVDVDENDIRDFMYKVLQQNIAERSKHGMDGAVADNIELILARYLKQRHAEERMVWTSHIHLAAGKPLKPVVTLKAPSQQRNTSGGIEIRWAVDNRVVVLSKTDLDEWLKDHKFSRTQTYDGLMDQYGATMSQKVLLGSGTIYMGQREPCFIMPIQPNSGLWDFLMMFAEPGQREAAEQEAAEAPVIETGFIEEAAAPI